MSVRGGGPGPIKPVPGPVVRPVARVAGPTRAPVARAATPSSPVRPQVASARSGRPARAALRPGPTHTTTRITKVPPRRVNATRGAAARREGTRSSTPKAHGKTTRFPTGRRIAPRRNAAKRATTRTTARATRTKRARAAASTAPWRGTVRGSTRKEATRLGRVDATTAKKASTWRAMATPGTALLTANLSKTRPKPVGSHTHHIVPTGKFGSRSMKTRRDIRAVQSKLRDLRIGPDEAANGVFLPANVHRRVHTDQYFSKLRSRLARADNQADARRVLQRTARDLEAGRFP